MKIYLDVCCLNRPFDDQTQDRVHLESEAIITVLEHCENKDWFLVSSEIIDLEVAQIPDRNRQQSVYAFLALHQDFIEVSQAIECRTIEIQKMSFDAYDAMHIACAESSAADVFLTTDDSLLKKAVRNRENIKIRVANPIMWIAEVLV